MWCLTFCILSLSLTVPVTIRGDGESSTAERSALKAAKYLQEDGRAWLEGEIDVQKQGCVSCHQVPSGLWSLSFLNHKLDRVPDAAFRQLLADANQFVTSPEDDNGVAAAVSQLLLTDAAHSHRQSLPEASGVARLVDLAVQSQRDDGTWASAGQYPSQRRPIRESDEVVTMWMIRALESAPGAAGDTTQAVARARQAVAQSSGESAEWLAWRMLIEQDSSAAAVLRVTLLQRQNADGSWSFLPDGQGEAYSTGVVLFALSECAREEARAAIARATGFLTSTQQDDGSWIFEASLISKKSSYSRDYVYRYWGTAWATLGLSASLDPAPVDGRQSSQAGE